MWIFTFNRKFSESSFKDISLSTTYTFVVNKSVTAFKHITLARKNYHIKITSTSNWLKSDFCKDFLQDFREFSLVYDIDTKDKLCFPNIFHLFSTVQLVYSLKQQLKMIHFTSSNLLMFKNSLAYGRFVLVHVKRKTK